MAKRIILDEEKAPSTPFEEIIKLRIYPSDIIPVPEVVLYFNDCMVMTRKNISCLTGKAKVGKTYLLTLLNQIILQKGEMNEFLKSYLPKGKDKILYIDTEQADHHILLILKRIKDFVGENKMDNLLMFNFDAIDIDKRREYTKELIYNLDGLGIVIIDGIADLIYDTNDIKESSILASDLRKWSVENDIHITSVLHQNPSENSKMKGHLGTILSNKSETVFQISTDKENESIKLVDTLFTRNKKPLPFAFEILEDGTPEIVDYEFTGIVKEKKLSKKAILNKITFDIINDCFLNVQEKGIGYGEFLDKVKRSFLSISGESLGDNYAKGFIKECVETSKIGYENYSKKYFLCEFISK